MGDILTITKQDLNKIVCKAINNALDLIYWDEEKTIAEKNIPDIYKITAGQVRRAWLGRVIMPIPGGRERRYLISQLNKVFGKPQATVEQKPIS